jgi:hypothetical protein
LAERSEDEIRRRLLSEYAARTSEFLYVQGRARALFFSALALGLVSLFTLFPSYSPRILGVALTSLTSLAGIGFVLQTYLTLRRTARFLDNVMFELRHDIGMVDRDYLPLWEQRRGLESLFLHREAYWGFLFLHLFCIAIAILKYFNSILLY